MIAPVLVPQAFENMEEATLGAWAKSVGDAVEIGDALCELITEKTTFDLPAEKSGVLLKIVTPEKSIVPVGTILGFIGEAGEDVPDASERNQSLLAKRAATADVSAAPDLSLPELKLPTAASSPTSASTSNAPTRVRATPAARRAARDCGVSIEDVAAKMGDKVLSEEDVRAFAAEN